MKMPLCSVLALLAFASAAHARPIGYAGGQMLMLDASDDLQQLSVTHAPSFRYAFAAGHLRAADLTGADDTLSTTYLRAAILAKRWNLPRAQANVFVWGGLGSARYAGADGSRHIGAQVDYETRRIYTSLVSELHEGSGFSYRFDTAAVGIAPYEHDMERMASWIVLKAKHTSNARDTSLKPEIAWRMFTAKWWLDAGIDADGKPSINLMLNY